MTPRSDRVRGSDRVRVLTWNVWWRFGPWLERQPGILTTLQEEDADIICLQEVWASDGGEDQARTLADALGYSFARTPSPFWEGFSFGNAILSRWPILGCEAHPLPDSRGQSSHRSALHASIDAPFGVIHIICTHIDYRFDRSSTRVAQTRAVAELVASVRGNAETAFPVIVAGDFNAMPDSDEMRSLLGRGEPPVPGLIFHDAWELAGDGTSGCTWSSSNPHLADAIWPNRRLDYVLVSWPRPKGVGTPVACRVVGTSPIDGAVPSDHYAVVADLRVR